MAILMKTIEATKSTKSTKSKKPQNRITCKTILTFSLLTITPTAKTIYCVQILSLFGNYFLSGSSHGHILIAHYKFLYKSKLFFEQKSFSGEK